MTAATGFVGQPVEERPLGQERQTPGYILIRNTKKGNTREMKQTKGARSIRFKGNCRCTIDWAGVRWDDGRAQNKREKKRRHIEAIRKSDCIQLFFSHFVTYLYCIFFPAKVDIRDSPDVTVTMAMRRVTLTLPLKLRRSRCERMQKPKRRGTVKRFEGLHEECCSNSCGREGIRKNNTKTKRLVYRRLL